MKGFVCILGWSLSWTPPTSVPPPCAEVYSPLKHVPAGEPPSGLCRGHEVPVLEQLPHCLQPWVSATSPAHPQCWPRGSESVHGAGGLTSASNWCWHPGVGTHKLLPAPACPHWRWVAGS